MNCPNLTRRGWTNNKTDKKQTKRMKNSIFIRGIAPVAVCALLLPTAASAQTTSFTATGYVNAVLSPGIVCINGLGQVLVRGAVHTARVQGTDARVTGQAFISGDGNYNADGTSYWQGPAYLQVGTWDVAGTNFTPTGGLWEGTWAGVMQTNYDLQLSIAGYGSGGSIDGWRLAETVIRTNASTPTDTNAPYFYTGTIKPPPISTNLIYDNFDTNVVGWSLSYNCGNIKMYGTNLHGTNQQLYTWANWANCPVHWLQNFFFAGAQASRPWNLADGQTLECQADLIRISENTTNTAGIYVDGSSGIYAFHVSQAGVGMDKWTSSMISDLTFFWWDNTVHVARTNVVLYMALTRDQGSLIITTRVLDKANPGTVLFERSFVDTPGVDASLTTSQFWALTGMTNMTLVRDSGAPVFNGWYEGGVAVAQFTDGHQPPVEALWDNFALRLHDEPPVSIARAVEITFAVPAGVSYILEAAPSVQGPWTRVQELEMPGIQKRTILVSGAAQFIRAVQAR